MSQGRFSFDNDDEASFAPRTNYTQPEEQFHSARGRDYVPSAQQYAPRDLSPAGSYHDDEPVARSDHDRSPPRNLIDSSPSRQPYHIPPPLEQAQRDPHEISAPPIPPPHRRMSSSDSVSRGVPYGAAAGFGTGAVADTAYHGAADYQDYQAYNPFDHAERSGMQPSAHGYPEYPQSTYDDPFASNRNSYNNLAVPNSYEMQQQRPGLGSRPDSFSGPYGNYNNAASSGDLGSFDPRDIADEEDDTGALAAKQKNRGSTAAGVAGVAGASGAAGAAGGFMKGMTSRDASGKYGAVPGGEPEKGPGGMNIVGKKAQGKRLKWIVAAIIVSVIVLACIGGGVGAYFELHKGSGSSSSSSDDSNGGDFDLNSSEIKKLLNNPNLHKVFPGMDYTPFNAQYPDCLSNMPSQNNVTMDVAVLSQLTPQIRLYGTDCNQTEMVLTAIDKLQLQSQVKVWLGVYLDGNQTTNDRQMSQMWNILDKSGADPFQGVIVGNEVLFSNYMPETQLVDTIQSVKQNLTSKHLNLPVATSDLGDNWNDTLAQPVDYVMANVHPVSPSVSKIFRAFGDPS